MKRRWLAGVAAVALVLGSCSSSPSTKASEEDNPTLTAPPTSGVPTTSTTTATTTTPATAAPTVAATTTVALPVPVGSPIDPLADEPDVVLGTIDIPKIGVHKTLRDGVRLSTLNKSPGHWPGSALPGQIGNMVIAGHRVTHDQPFRNIDKLVAGDEVRITLPAGQLVTYKVSSTEVVPNTALWIVNQTAQPTGTLFACHPPGSARERIVVHLQLATA
ncbi:MAG: peptidase family protein [Acidimicrobiia bacterium]|nr:peptidase family protein [Acidimicrobiia bacterium]